MAPVRTYPAQPYSPADSTPRLLLDLPLTRPDQSHAPVTNNLGGITVGVIGMSTGSVTTDGLGQQYLVLKGLQPFRGFFVLRFLHAIVVVERYKKLPGVNRNMD